MTILELKQLLLQIHSGVEFLISLTCAVLGLVIINMFMRRK